MDARTRLMLRRLMLRALLAVVPAAAAGAGAHAADGPAYPRRPVRFIVGFPPGGPSDILARLVGERLSLHWGERVVTENRPGAGGNLAAEAAAHSAADGYTWLLANNSVFAINPSLYPHLPFDPAKDFEPVVLIATQPSVLVVNPQLPVQSVQELVALARQRPGQLNFASSGTGTAAHLAGELFKSMTGVDLVHVPYKGAQPALTDVLANRAQLMFATSASVIGFVKDGRLRALAVTSSAPSPQLPGIPTVDASVPGFEAVSWHGVMTPAGTPAPIIEQINRAVRSVLEDAEVRERLSALGADPAGGTPSEFARYVARDAAKWAAIVKRSGAHPD
jgi:tripartite-type tricarboxylate transporter receptor subunit TctC